VDAAVSQDGNPGLRTGTEANVLTPPPGRSDVTQARLKADED